MPRSCIVCARTDRDEIEHAAQTGESIRAVAIRFTLTPASLQRHLKAHRPTPSTPPNPAEPDGRRKGMCRGRSKKTGKPCGKRAIRGATVCKSHGAGAPQVQAAAARRVEEQEVRAELASIVAGIPEQPTELGLALMEELGRAEGVLAYLSQRLAVQGHHITEENYRTGTGSPHPLVSLYGEWSERRAKLAAVCAKLGLEERRVRLEEDQRRTLVDAIDRGLVAAGLSAEVVRRVKTSIATELRVLLELAA